MQPFRLIYLLPNLFTAASIFLGVLSVIEASHGNFERAAWFIVISMIFDGLDGRVARMTNTASKFGLEFDSLADIVAFGVAPAMLLYFYIGQDYGKFGSFASALFVIFGAVRLARFNVTTINNDPSVFIGIPIPMAAVFMVSWVLVFEDYGIKKEFALYLLLATFVVGFLMVSNFRYPSFKKINIDNSKSLRVLSMIILLFSFLYLYPIEFIAIMATIYMVWGVVKSTYHVFLRINLFKKS